MMFYFLEAETEFFFNLLSSKTLRSCKSPPSNRCDPIICFFFSSIHDLFCIEHFHFSSDTLELCHYYINLVLSDRILHLEYKSIQFCQVCGFLNQLRYPRCELFSD
eukprot:TRINITY_DN3646_c0_g1_i6.p1 TRINITY_DN3646_c0_g1~~TRINITY_DN3646_c0_g1_i6.p1  ORF type:complete len:106 (+),score=8.01 TRINITY_DN3646_c0_g1_i6:65-382(+)